MKISKEHVDDLNATIALKIEPEDYQTRVGDILSDYKKKVHLDGFRPGKVPMGLIRKMYYKPVLVEEVNKMISESLSKYFIEEKLRILGEPMPSEKKMEEINWDEQTEFEFFFDIALAPDFEIELSGKTRIPYYTIKIDKKMKESYVEGYARRHGSYEKATEITTGEEMVTGTMEQIRTDADGFTVDQANFSLAVIKDEKIQKNFMGKKIGDTVAFDLKKAFPNDTEVSSILKVDKEKVAEINGDFKCTINEISRFANAEINQELFDQVFGQDVVKTKAAFETEIEKEIRKNLDQESALRFAVDARDHLVNQLKLKLPEEFLFRWLVKTNEGKYTKEEIEKDFDHFKKDLEWQLIKDNLVEKESLQVEESEILAYAKEVTFRQFMQYGLTNIPEDQLEHYAKEILNKKEERQKLLDKLLEDKVIAHVKQNVKIDEKSISADAFNKLYEKSNGH
jgi:trigger factor